MIRREDARADVLRELGAKIVLGDLLDIDSVRAALEDIDAFCSVYPTCSGPSATPQCPSRNSTRS